MVIVSVWLTTNWCCFIEQDVIVSLLGAQAFSHGKVMKKLSFPISLLSFLNVIFRSAVFLFTILTGRMMEI